MGLPEVTLPMDVVAIQKCIPHRYPFLLVDRVIEFQPGESIKGLRNISFSDPVLQGHFPGNPVYPGVHIIEGLAQTAAIFGHLSTEGGCSQCLLTEVTDTRFRKPVVPGDTLIYECKAVKRRSPFFWFEAKAWVDNTVVATVNFSALMK